MQDSNTSVALGRAFLDLLPVTGVSIAVFSTEARHSTIYASDVVAARIDELQFDLGEGPSFESVRTTKPTLLGNLGDNRGERWPMFAAGVADTTARALFVFPLVMGAMSVGVASLYRDSPGDLTEDDVDTGVSVARSIAGPALRRAVQLSHEDPARENPTLDGLTAVELRRDVHQATGMVLAQLNISPTDAFSRLQAYAFSTNQTVQAVARDVLARRLDFSLLGDDNR